MADPRLFRLRVVFCKQGRLALLSHLEVARALERTVRRAGLPFAVSQGFSPHMRIAFGAALPVGVGGTHEVFDLQLVRYVAPEHALEALQNASAPDLMCKSCSYVEPRAAAASVAFPISTYRALLSFAPGKMPVPETVRVVRKRKEKVLSVADFLVGGIGLAGAVATFSLEAKPTGSLRPDLLLRACVDAYNEGALLEGSAGAGAAASTGSAGAGAAASSFPAGSTGAGASFSLAGLGDSDAVPRAEREGSAAPRAKQGVSDTHEPLRVVSLTRIAQCG